MSEIQALSCNVGFSAQGAHVSLLPHFRAKNDNLCKGLPRFFAIKSLTELVGPEEEACLCPVRALKTYLARIQGEVGKAHPHLFVSPRNPKLPLSKNGISYFLRTLIREAHVNINVDNFPVLKVKLHEVRAVTTSVNFKKNLSLESVMLAAQWRCNSVFAAHYLKDIEISYESCKSLGPFVSAGTVIA